MTDTPESPESAANRLISLINYQVFRPLATTMGLCPQCRYPSRGGGKCTKCLTRELGQVVGDKAAEGYTSAALTLAEQRDYVYQLAIGE